VKKRNAKKEKNNLLDTAWMSKYNDDMKTDNTINLIGRIKELASITIVSEMERLGMEGIVTSHGDIIATLMEYEALTMTEIAEKIHRDRSTVTTLVKKLNAIGVTETKKNEQDQRSNLVFLTTKGKELKEGFKEISEKLYDIQFKGVSDEEKEIFRHVLMKMYKNFMEQVE
jgi:DNA-binding MarR family transcriptional regulator